MFGARRADHPKSLVYSQLHRGRADTPARNQNQGGLARACVGSSEQGDPCREKHDGRRGGLDRRERLRVAEQVARGHDDVVGVAAVANERHRAVTHIPALYVRSHPRYLAGHLEAGAVGAGRNGVVQARSHEQVRKVHSHGVHLEVHFAGAGIAQRDLTLDQHLGQAVALDQDGGRGSGGHAINSNGMRVEGRLDCAP